MEIKIASRGESLLNKLMCPRSIAVIGATDKGHSVGNAIFRNLLGHFKGILYPVNPKLKSVFGVKAYASIQEIEDDIDLAVIIVPRNVVASVLHECGRCGILSVVVITAGFKEIGGEGIAYEDEVVNIAREYGISLVGPNCFGIINTEPGVHMNATFARTIPEAGNVAFISQSGSAGAYALEYAAANDIGISKFVSIGNKAVLNENDFLKAFSRDESTKVILAYIEQFEDAREFLKLARKITSGPNPKPILVIKSGRSKSGHRAAASHTGSLVEQDDLLDHLFNQCGVIRVSTMEILFNFARCFANQPLPAGHDMAIITNAGGPAIISCDEAEKYDLSVPELSGDVQEKLKKNMPETVSTKNPVDLVGDADALRYRNALEVLVNSEEVDIIHVLAIPQMMTDLEHMAKEVAEYSVKARTQKKTMITSFAGFGTNEKIDRIMSMYHIPNYTFPESAIMAVSAMAKFASWTRRSHGEVRQFDVDRELVDGIVKRSASEERTYLSQPESYAIFKAYGFDVANYEVVNAATKAADAADAIGYPVVMKIVSPEVVHKFDWGGVKVNLRNREQVMDAYEEIVGNVRSRKVDVKIDGVLVQEMITGGVELIMGALKNELYGHLLMFGMGGTYVEVFKDVSFRMAPLTRADAGDMISETKVEPILSGYRGLPVTKKERFIELLQRLSQLVVDFPQIAEIDLNPVFAMKEGGRIADARIILDS